MPISIKHILFPTDFSENAAKALPFALEAARRFEANLTILHVVHQPYDFATIADQIRQTSETYASSQLDELQKQISRQDEFHQLDVYTQVLHGQTVLSILEAADEFSADLIIMGTKGATGLERMFFGSVTTELLLRARIPVLAIPNDSTYHGYEHILFTTDFHDGDIEALQDVAEWARAFRSRITVLHIDEESNLETDIMFRGFRELAREVVRYEKLDFELIQEYSFFSGLVQFLDQHDVSMLVLTRYKKPFFYSLIERNHSREMGEHTRLPLLVLAGQETPDDWLKPNN